MRHFSTRTVLTALLIVSFSFPLFAGQIYTVMRAKLIEELNNHTRDKDCCKGDIGIGDLFRFSADPSGKYNTVLAAKFTIPLPETMTKDQKEEIEKLCELVISSTEKQVYFRKLIIKTKDGKVFKVHTYSETSYNTIE